MEFLSYLLKIYENYELTKDPFIALIKNERPFISKKRMNGIKKVSQNTLKKDIRQVSIKTQDCLSQEKEENLEEYEDIESDFSQKISFNKTKFASRFSRGNHNK